MAQKDLRKQEFVAAVAVVASYLAEQWFNENEPPQATTMGGMLPPEPGDPLFNRKEAAKFLRVSVSTLGRLVKTGDIKPVMLTGKAPKYRRRDLERFIDRK